MATTVGATLASSKLAVTQGDLHLVGSSVDQLVVQFDQATSDEFLAADRVKASKTRKRRHKTRAAATRLAAASPLSSPSLPLSQRRSTPSPNDGSISAPSTVLYLPPGERDGNP